MNNNLIPNYLRARSPERLRSLMMQKNLKDKTFYKYFDISSYKDKNNKLFFIAWYYEKLEAFDGTRPVD